MGQGKSNRLDSHVNYALRDPQKGETQIAYALDCAAHLVSPPKVPGESEENECVDVARQIRELIPILEQKWREWEGN